MNIAAKPQNLIVTSGPFPASTKIHVAGQHYPNMGQEQDLLKNVR